ncbi:nitrate reductase molybdenum cofactor assembly chaperone [Neobacillus niacini]|uniref:nitrate reductase molybdenum cofactor assembly chaperone n=1 Tax=Neobacillus niacini TaxID=86668 RepID=UPI0028660634|nr:nitrate reductase molybdenum cofactor assembly chaperone [Neobacillus niacini]MDR6998293.1 nitrate reductase delta subunit [Neobacillus niacini]
MGDEQRIFGLASVLLQHPEKEWMEENGLKEEIALIENPLIKLLLKQFLRHLNAHSYFELCTQYSETFDFNDKTTLYLTYSLFGESPDRGKALVKLKQEYFEAGFPLESDELPDFLPLIFEFCAIAPEKSVQKMLMIHRKTIHQLLKELSLINSPYQMVIQASVQLMEKMLSNQKAS